MPSFNYRIVVKKLRKLGFVPKRQCEGSHEFWINLEREKQVMLSRHGNKDFPTGTMNSLAKELGFKNLKDFENFK